MLLQLWELIARILLVVSGWIQSIFEFYVFYRLYKKDVIKHVIGDIISRGYAFQMEIIVRANEYNYSFEEVPIVFVDRIEGQSKMEGAEITKFLKSVWKLYNTF